MRKFLAALTSDPITAARQSVVDAMKDLARREAEEGYHRALRNFHDEEAQRIDPYQDWNAFANHMNQREDARADEAVETGRVRRARAKVDAAKDRFHKLQNAPQG